MASQSFPEFITARRRELDLTLGDVANSLGVSPITVSNWSAGDSKPKPENLIGLAALLDVPADELAKMAGVTLQPPRDASVNLMPPEPPATPEAKEIEVPVSQAKVVAAQPTPADRPGEVDVPAAVPEAGDAFDSELADLIGAAAPVLGGAPAGVPAAVPTPSAPRPAPARAPASARPRPAPATVEREVLTLPLTYIEDPRQLMRYRIRWALTVVVLLVMFVVLLWASRELISALSEIKQAVTPGGGVGGS